MVHLNKALHNSLSHFVPGNNDCRKTTPPRTPPPPHTHTLIQKERHSLAHINIYNYAEEGAGEMGGGGGSNEGR